MRAGAVIGRNRRRLYFVAINRTSNLVNKFFIYLTRRLRFCYSEQLEPRQRRQEKTHEAHVQRPTDLRAREDV